MPEVTLEIRLAGTFPGPPAGQARAPVPPRGRGAYRLWLKQSLQ